MSIMVLVIGVDRVDGSVRVRTVKYLASISISVSKSAVLNFLNSGTICIGKNGQRPLMIR